MSLSQPRTIFGVHSLTAFRRDNGMPYGPELRVIQGSTFSSSAELIQLFGGSNIYSWAAETGDATSELAFGVSEYPNWLFEVFGGSAPTQGTAEASGFASSITAKKGVSVVAATGLLPTITVDTAANLKTGRYVVKATAVNAFKVYALSDVDFGRGAALDFLDDSMAIAEFTAVAGLGSTHAIAGLGITLTTGASAAAFVVDDTAVFELRAVNTYNREVKIGGISDVFPEFSAIAYGQKNGRGAIWEMMIYRLKNAGITVGSTRKEFASNEYTATALYDSEENGVALFREVE